MEISSLMLRRGMLNLNRSKLSHLQIGYYEEYYIKMKFTLYSFDVYTSEVDDYGMDFMTI